MPSRLSCRDCHTRLEPRTSYVRPFDRGWDFLCSSCYALTEHGRIVPPPGFQLYAMGWVDHEGYSMVGSERSSREYIEQELERHRVNGWLHPTIKYEVLEVPGNVEVRWPRSEPRTDREALVNALNPRCGTLGDDARRHDDDPPPIYFGIYLGMG